MPTKKPPPTKSTQDEPERWRRFVEAFMGEARGDQGRAAKLAGYEGTDKSLSERGRRLLKRPEVQAMVAERRAECPMVAAREEIHEALTRTHRWEGVTLGKGKKKLYPNYKEWLRATELLMKSLGMFVERKELKVEGQVVVRAELPANGRDDNT